MELYKKLKKLNILSIKGIFSLIVSISQNGMNLMTLLGFSAKINSNKSALVFGEKKYTYSELYKSVLKLSFVFEDVFKIKKGQKVGLLFRNNDFAVKTTFALSAIGVNIYFLNEDMATNQLKNLITNLKLDFVVFDSNKLDENGIFFLSKHNLEKAFDEYSFEKNKNRKGLRNGEIVVLSGGTTGEHKKAKRKTSIKNYSNPIFELLRKLDLDEFKSIFISPPFYHGFGLSALLIAFLLGVEVFIAEKFEPEKNVDLIFENNIEVICLVPVILQRMLYCDRNKLKSLKRIISGGAPLSVALIKKTLASFDDVLYNLYGTSEAGFSVLANPEILQNHSNSVGRPIRGVKLKILTKNDEVLSKNKIGRICIKTSWSMNNKTSKWVDTGDLGYLDENGLLFLSGRADEMIVSGGENVYPFELENILSQNEKIKEVAVIGVEDDEFGKRLKAFVVAEKEVFLSENEIFDWLKGKVARYEMPVKIEIVDELKYTDIGKLDKKNM